MEAKPTQVTYQNYLNEGFKPLRCAGYNSTYNQEIDPEKKYKRAKEAIDEGFTKNDFVSLSMQTIEAWEKTGGWVGWLIPKGFIAIDAEEQEAIEYIKNLCKKLNIIPPEHNTNRGKHFFFKLNKNLSAASEVYTKSGFKLTYRIGGKNYLILAPTNGRSWEVPL